MKDTLTFDQLPEAVTKMQEKLDNIEQLLLQRQEQSPEQEELMPITKAAEFLDLVSRLFTVKYAVKKSPLISVGSACISTVPN